MTHHSDPPRMLDARSSLSAFGRTVLEEGLHCDPTPKQLDNVRNRLLLAGVVAGTSAAAVAALGGASSGAAVAGASTGASVAGASAAGTSVATAAGASVAGAAGASVGIAATASATVPIAVWFASGVAVGAMALGVQVVATRPAASERVDRPAISAPAASVSAPRASFTPIFPATQPSTSSSVPETVVTPVWSPTAPIQVPTVSSSATIPATPPLVSASAELPPPVVELRAATPVDEVELLGRALRALEAGRASSALEVANEHARLPNTKLAQERERIAIEALVRLGQMGAANARAQRFYQAFPGSSHRPRLERITQLPASSASTPPNPANSQQE